MGARNVLATNLVKKISWGPRRAVRERERERERESEQASTHTHALKNPSYSLKRFGKQCQICRQLCIINRK